VRERFQIATLVSKLVKTDFLTVELGPEIETNVVPAVVREILRKRTANGLITFWITQDPVPSLTKFYSAEFVAELSRYGSTIEV
jgi:hypothetical protein